MSFDKIKKGVFFMEYLSNEEIKALLVLARKQDEQAINKIIKNYNRCLWKIIHSCCSKLYVRSCDYDDLYQEGVLGILAAIEHYKDNEDTTFTTYVYLICTRRIHKLVSSNYKLYTTERQLSSLKVEDESRIYNVASDDVSVSEQMHQRLKMDILKKVMLTLDDKEKQIIYLYLREKTYKEIAERMMLNVKQVDYQIRKCKLKLLDAIKALPLHEVEGVFEQL